MFGRSRGFGKKGTESEAGFTLIEMSIVLVIIGLIIGGVLKGQELIASTRLKATVSQWDGIKAGYNAFQDRYLAIPGDFAAAAAQIRAAGVVGGNGNGVLGATSAVPFAVNVSATQENLNFWAHMAAANLINGVTVGNAVGAATAAGAGGVPAGRMAGNFWMALSGTANGITSNFGRLQNGTAGPLASMNGVQYAEIERKFDDTSSISGSIMELGTLTCSTVGTGALSPLSRVVDCIVLFDLQ